MEMHGQALGIDELLDQAGDAVARNDWGLAKSLAEEVLRQARHHPEAELLLRSADAYLESERAPDDPFSGSRDLRFMSMMFCDVVGSTQLASELGDALWRSTLERFRRRSARAVRRYDGYIHEATGDELLILFGYPRVREDDARRAVLAGLDVVAAVESFSALLQRERGISFRARVGIHTGRALIRERSAGSKAAAGDAEIGGGLVGEAAHIAKRIETAARPDTVWVSSATRRIVEGFFDFAKPFESGSRVDVRGSANILAHEVTGRTGALNRHQIARVRSDEMVGRQAERTMLLELWEQAQGAGAPFVVVSGQAGIGKSRLVEFLAETAAGSRGNRLECICTEMQQGVAFAPLIGLIERFANIRQADVPETRVSKLHAAFHELSPEFDEFMQYLAWMMSIPAPATPALEDLEPEVIRKRIFDNLLKVLRLGASIRPSVLWIEDIQWADRSTQEFCRQLEAQAPIPGLMVVATMRTGHAQSDSMLPWSDTELATGRIVSVELGPLSPEESKEMIASRSASPPSDTETRAMLESTGGNPLYIEEVVRAFAADGTTRQDVRESGRLPIGVPESLQPIFAQIVDRLGRDRQVAQLASLLGRDLPEPLTRTVISSILAVSETEVAASLARLIDAEIVEPLLTELSPGHRFRHELIREALAHSVGSDGKRNHGRIAGVIEQSFPDYAQDRPALLAYHHTKAENFQQAAEYRLAAGCGLQARAAHEEAIASFDQGLESLGKLSADQAAHAKLELPLVASRGVSIQTIKGYADEQAGKDWARAYELSKQIEATATVVPALGGVWSFYFVRGGYKTSGEVAVEMVEAAATLGDVEASLIAHVCLGYSQYFQGDFIAGRRSVEHSRTLHDQVKDRPPHIHVPQDPGIAGLSVLGPVRWSLGDQLGGIRAAEESLAMATALESKRAINLVRVGVFNAWFHQIRRRPDEALRASEAALAVASAHRIEWAIVNLSIHKGLAMAHLDPKGQGLLEGTSIAKQCLGYWRAAGSESMVPYFLGQLGEAHHLAGDHIAACELLDQAIELGEKLSERCHDAELYRVRGQAKLAGGTGDRSQGLADLRKAAAAAGSQQAVSFEIRSILSLVTVGSEISHHEGWIERLEDALRRLETSENSTDERAARALIARERQSGAHASE